MGGKRKRYLLISLLLLFFSTNLIVPENPLKSNQQTSLNNQSSINGRPNQQAAEQRNDNWQSDAQRTISTVNKERINILLLGIDARNKREPSRSDSMLLLSINTKNNTAAALSLLRDTYVTIPNVVAKQRINTAFALGGPSLTLKTVSNFLQVPVEYYVVADFQAFEKAVDVMGGVDIDIEKSMDYTDDGIYDIHLQPGKQHLSGAQALGYARFRHDVRGDFARVERQRKLIQAIITKAKGIQGFYYLPRIFESIRPYIQTNLDVRAAAGIIYLGCRLSGIETHTIPDNGAFRIETIDGMSVLVPDVQQVRANVRALLP